MQRREQIILGVLLATVVTWQGGGWVASAVLDPFQTRSDTLARLKKSVKEKEDQELMLVRAKKSLAAMRDRGPESDSRSEDRARERFCFCRGQTGNGCPVRTTGSIS